MTRTSWPTVLLVTLAMLVAVLAGCGGDDPCQNAGVYCDGNVACVNGAATDCDQFKGQCPSCGRCVNTTVNGEVVAVCTRLAP